MKPTTINVQIVRNLGNYESARYGGEWTLDKGESLTDALAAAERELIAAADALHPRAGAEKKAKAEEEIVPPPTGDDDKREVVKFGSPVLQAIINRINNKNKPTPTLDEIKQFYRLSNKAEQVINLQFQIN